MKGWIVKFRIFLWLALVVIVCWFLYMGIAPSGWISYTCDFKKPSGFISELSPIERIGADNKTIIGDPVYFSLYAPRKFSKAKLILKYKRKQREKIRPQIDGRIFIEKNPIIEAGVLADKTVWRYELNPLENQIIDQLSLSWDIIRNEDLILLQRPLSDSSSEKRYDSIEKFFHDLPKRDEIALYNYDLKAEYILKDYSHGKPDAGDGEWIFNSEITHPLRGAYQFYTYVKNEDLDFIFYFVDLNENKDKDDINLHLYYNGQLIDSQYLKDSGGNENSGEIGLEREFAFKTSGLPEGVYKIELIASDDIITKSIKTKQSKLAFINKLWMADKGNSNIKIYSDSRILSAKTVNPGRLQTIKFRGSDLKISKTYTQFDVRSSSSSLDIILEKDDVILAGSGVFSFDKSALINPGFKKVDLLLNIDQDKINYILARYKTPQKQSDWNVAEANFDLTKACCQNRKYGFIISIPGLKADDNISDGIEIKEITIKLEGKNLMNYISDLLNRATHRIKGVFGDNH